MHPPSPAGPDGPPAVDSATGKLLGEIADLAASPLPESVFLQELLKRAVAILEAGAGVIWMYDAERRLALQCEIRLQATGFLEDTAFRAGFERPFADVLRSGGVLVHEAERATLRDGVSKCRVLLGGLQRETEVAGLVQLFEPPGAAESDRPARLRILEQICGQAARFWQRRQFRADQDEPSPATTAGDPWTVAFHESLKSIEVATVAANECRRLLGVDRVAIGERHGPGVRILAVSGQQTVNPRSNVVRLLSELAQEVLQTGEKLAFVGDTRKLPPQIERLLADYLHESHSRALVVAPLSGPESHDQPARDSVEAAGEVRPKPLPVGVLVVEQISETPFPADLDARLERMASHLGLALRNAQAHERIFLLSLWELLGNWKSRLKGRRLAQFGAGLALAVVIVLALVALPWDYRVVGKGRLMPVDRRGVFAPLDGEVVEIPVRSGQTVEKGDLLVRLRNVELQTRLHEKQNLLLEKRKERASTAAQLSELAAALNPEKEVELRGKLSELGVVIQGAEMQVEMLTRQVEALSVRSPITGVVATFRIEEMLRERPVKRGDLLLEVMDPSGTWRLELDVPENRLGHILQAQQRHDDGRLPVRYVLATATEATYDGSLESISTRSVISETEGTVVPLYASLADPVPSAPRIGADVIAKIDCGRRSLGYVLFGDVIEFVRKRFWL